MESLLQDFKFSLRMLIKKPAFTFAALLTLTLGIGANTAVFSIINATLLRPLPYKNADQLVMVWHNYSETLSRANVSPPAFNDYKEQAESFENIGAMTNWSVNLTGQGEAVRLAGFRATASLFPTLGVHMAIGRSFLPEEDQPGHNREVIISHGLWKRLFGADPKVINKPITLNGIDYQIIGVLPSDFEFAKDVDVWSPIAFTPVQLAPQNHGNEYLGVVARIKPGLTVKQAQAEMDTLSARLKPQFYSFAKNWHIVLVPMREQIVGDLRLSLLILMAAVGLVLLIACTNVANLLLTRSIARQKEFAIRTALGATRSRIIRQLLTESMTLAVIGGILGFTLSVWAGRLLIIGLPEDLNKFIVGSNAMAVDIRILAFTMTASLVTGIIFGLAPALQASKPDLNESFKEAGGGGGTANRHLFRDFLVVSEIALALVLLIGAGLLIKSFIRLQAVSPGFNSENVLTLQLSLPASRYQDTRQSGAFYQQLLERVKSLPGVKSAGAVSNLPLSDSNWNASFVVEGHTVAPGESFPHGDPRAVTPDYFNAMGIPLLKGRYFDAHDSADAAHVAIIDETLANHYWPSQNPLGKRIAFEGSDEKPDWREIVGVVGHVKHYGLDEESKEQYYFPHSQSHELAMFVVVRSTGDALSLTSSVRGAVESLDINQPIYAVKTIDQVLSDSLLQRRFSMLVLGVFAAIALILASVGVYGVMAYSVSQRSREIGIRMALGAQTGSVLRLVLGKGMLLTMIGVVAGLVIALPLTRFISSLLFGVSATDLMTFFSISLLIAFVALLASFLPARRATRLDPMIALRYE